MTILKNSKTQTDKPYQRPDALSVQERISEVFESVRTLVLSKNSDYGSAFLDSPILLPDERPSNVVLVRMSDKISRIIQLTKLERSPTQTASAIDESLDDSIRDLMGYCALWLVARDQRDEQ